VGGTPATGVTCSTTSCTATTPPGTAGPAQVTVTTGGQTSKVNPAATYTYV
jgi:hypothetical protein